LLSLSLLSLFDYKLQRKWNVFKDNSEINRVHSLSLVSGLEGEREREGEGKYAYVYVSFQVFLKLWYISFLKK